MNADPDGPPPERYWALRPRKRDSRGRFQRLGERLTRDPQARDFLRRKWVEAGRMVDVAEFVILPAGRGAVRHVQVRIDSYMPKEK